MDKTYAQQMKDSDIIFTAICTSGFANYQQAENAVRMAYVADMSFSRAGISHALKRLDRYYKYNNTSSRFKISMVKTIY